MNPSSSDDENHQNNSDFIVAPMDSILRFVPRPMRFENAPIEASGLSVDIFARATIVMSSMFLGPALLELASEAAQENCNDNDCRIYGFRPSSLLANIAIVAGLLVSILLPLFGAIVDHTRFRRQVGAYTAAGLVVVKGIEVCVGRKTWFFVALLQVVSSLLYNPHITATYAYTSELSSDPTKQTEYNTQLIVIMYISTLLFLVEVLGLAAILGTDDVGTARISQTITSLTSAVLFYFCWEHLFRDTPAQSHVPDGTNLVTCGFRKVLDTAYRIQYYPALKYLMLSIVFSEAATGALVTIATTYLTQVLEMDSTEIGILFLVVLLAGIPGSKVGGWLAIRLKNPIASAKLADCLFIVVTAAASFVLTGPERKHMSLVFGFLWGILLGWLPPIHTTAYITLIPKGQEAELMAMYLLCGQIFAWLPPLVFTVLNEAGFDMAYGMMSLSLYFFVGLMFLMAMGDYNQAFACVEVVRNEIEMEHAHPIV